MPTFTCLADITAPDADAAQDVVSECLNSVQDALDSGELTGVDITFDDPTEGAAPVIGALQACARWMLSNHKSHTPEFAYAVKALSDAGFDLHRALVDEEPESETVYTTREDAVRAIESLLGSGGSYALAGRVYDYMREQGIVTYNGTGFVIERDTNVLQIAADLLSKEDPDCAEGMHSWVNETGKLPPDTACTRCGALYGHPD
jgi:hypothetical protein